MRVGLFFGSFNPIHNGHTELAQYFLQAARLDEVWLMVSPNNPLKQQSELWDEKVRLALARLATQDLQGIRVSDFEFALPRPSYTINTLQALQKQYPQVEFCLLIGSDNMAVFERWKDYETILTTYPIYVYPRKGDNLEQLTAKYPQMKLLQDAPLLDISATKIRHALQRGEPIQGFVHPAVSDFIHKELQKAP